MGVRRYVHLIIGITQAALLVALGEQFGDPFIATACDTAHAKDKHHPNQNHNACPDPDENHFATPHLQR